MLKQIDKQAIRRLLNKVNKVTAPFRHGQKIPDRDLISLSNYQIDFEKLFEATVVEDTSSKFRVVPILTTAQINNGFTSLKINKEKS